MTDKQTPDAVREASWTGEPHKLAAELRRVASVFDPKAGFRLPQLLRDAADEIDCLAALDSRAGDAALRYALQYARNLIGADEIIDAALSATPAPPINAPSECPECGDTSPLEECATCGAYPTRKDATPAPAVDAVPAGEVGRLNRIRSSMALLQQNSEGCAHNHYGDDATVHGMPGWLIDTKADLDAFTDLLTKWEADRG